MCRFDKTEHKFKKPLAEQKEDQNATNIHNALRVQLFQGTEYVVAQMKEKWRI